MKSLPAPERSGVVVLRWMGSLCLGLGLLILLASLAILIISVVGQSTGVRVNPMVSLLTAFYSIPLLALGVLMRWLGSVYELLKENNRLLKQNEKNDQGGQA